VDRDKELSENQGKQVPGWRAQRLRGQPEQSQPFINEKAWFAKSHQEGLRKLGSAWIYCGERKREFSGLLAICPLFVLCSWPETGLTTSSHSILSRLPERNPPYPRLWLSTKLRCSL
jgi:hypothetical protein